MKQTILHNIFLGILVDEHLSWIDHINTLENKNIKKLKSSVQRKTIVKCQGNKKSLFLHFP